MPLPILQAHAEPTRDDLIRLFHRTELHWTQHLAEQAELDAGTAFSNPRLPQVHDANRMLNAFLPEGVRATDAATMAREHFASSGTKCWRWSLNPSLAEEQTKPLAEYLIAQGFKPVSTDILYLEKMPTSPIVESAGLTIIPARASFRHARALAEEEARRWATPQLADAAMLHLDDPHWDALIAMQKGKAAAKIGVLSVGEIGRIEDLFVSQPYRGQGIGRTMMGRALEICARSLFKHIFVSVGKENPAASRLYAQLGFHKIGEWISYDLE